MTPVWYDANRQPPTYSGERSSCGLCDATVIARCGQVVAWHWAHASARECDSWWEAETRWHRTWKAEMPPDRREVCIGRHRADLVRPDGTVIELQHSPISPADIAERERFYGRMVWLIDGTMLADRLLTYQHPHYVAFVWKHPRRSLAVAQRPLYVDLGRAGVLHVRRLDIGRNRVPTRGWGHVLTRAQFVARVLLCEPAGVEASAC